MKIKYFSFFGCFFILAFLISLNLLHASDQQDTLQQPKISGVSFSTATDSNCYKNLWLERDGAKFVKITSEIIEEYNKNSQKHYDSLMSVLRIIPKTLQRFSETGDPTQIDERELDKDEKFKYLIIWRLSVYGGQLNTIANELFSSDTYELTSQSIDIFFELLKKLNDTEMKRSISLGLLRKFKAKLIELRTDKNFITETAARDKLSTDECFLNFGQQIMEMAKGKIPLSLAEEYYGIIRCFHLVGITGVDLPKAMNTPLLAEVMEPYMSPSFLKGITETDEMLVVIRQNRKLFESLLDFSQSYGIEDRIVSYYRMYSILPELPKLSNLEAFSYSLQFIELLEKTQHNEELILAYLMSFLRCPTSAQHQLVIEKFSQYLPNFFKLYETYVRSEDPLHHQTMVSICNALLLSYVSWLKYFDANSFDKRVENFISFLNAQKAKKEVKTTSNIQGRKKLSKKAMRAKIVASVQAEKDQREKAWLALEELQQKYKHPTRLGGDNLTISSSSSSQSFELSLSTNVSQEAKKDAAEVIANAERKANIRKQRASQSSSSSTQGDKIEDKKIETFDNSYDSVIKHLGEERSPRLSQLSAAQLVVLKLFFNTNNGQRKNWNNDIPIILTQLRSLIKALGGRIDESRGKGGHLMIFFGQQEIATLYNPAVVLSHIDGKVGTLAATIKLWDSERLPPYLIEKIRNILIAQKMVPRDL